jgi:hypothetical protein
LARQATEVLGRAGASRRQAAQVLQQPLEPAWLPAVAWLAKGVLRLAAKPVVQALQQSRGLALLALEVLGLAGRAWVLEVLVLQRPSGPERPELKVLRLAVYAPLPAVSASQRPAALVWRRAESGPRTRRA